MRAATSPSKTRLLAPYRGPLAAAGVFSLFLNLLILTVPIYTLQIFDRVLSSRSVETLVMLTLAAGVALLTLATLDAVRSRVLLRIGIRLESELSREALRAGIAASARQPEDRGGAQGPRDAAELRHFLTGPGMIALFDVPWVPVFVAVVFLLHPVLGAVALTGAVMLFGLALLNEIVTRRSLRAAHAAGTAAHAQAEGYLQSADVIMAMGMLPNAIKRWHRANAGTLSRLAIGVGRAGVLAGAAKLARLGVQVAIMAVAAYLILCGDLTPGAMIAASILMGRALAPVEVAIGGWRGLTSARAAYRRLAAALGPTRARIGCSAMRLPRPEGRLQVEQVIIAPPGAEQPVLRRVSFALAPGEALGIVGPSAAGKSTLARVVAGVWKPDHGAVRLDDADVYAWDPDDRGQHIGYLPQDVRLLAGTVAENIARLDPEAPAAAVIRAARMAGVHEMILRLPHGYETEVGDGGRLLSGGQRQRIGLARALFGRPRLIVLDEPNSHLDQAGEEGLHGAIAAAKATGATVVLITHRPSTLAAADKLLMLRDGVVELFGPASEVLAGLLRPVAQPAAADAGPHLAAATMRAVGSDEILRATVP